MKKTWVRKTLSVGIFAAGALLLAPAAAAQADVDQLTTGNFGTLNGTQVAIPVTVPVNLVGNSAGILGSAQSFGVGANQVESGGAGGTTQRSAQNRGTLNGTQVAVPITVPVNVSGNAAAVAGKASATGISANRVENGWNGIGGGGTDQVSFGNFGTLNGTQVAVPITAPVNACGNALALIGGAGSTGVCANQVGGGSGFARKAQPFESKSKAKTKHDRKRVEGFFPGSGGIGIGQTSFSNHGTLNGTQVAAPITVPINACGNSLGVLGYASAHGSCANYVGGGVAYRKPVQWKKHLVPVYTPGYMLGGSDCDDWNANVYRHMTRPTCGDNGGAYGGVPSYGDPGYGYGECDNKKHKGNKGHNQNCKPVKPGKPGKDYGQVSPDRGNDGYGDTGDQGNDGYGQGGRDNAGYPADVDDDTSYGSPVGGDQDDNAYVKGDKYGNTKVGGRSAEKSAVGGLTQDLGTGGLGGLDLLNTLR
ncbi:chaplin family protein [Actinoplanes sp. G11-F43]|uniref:chaplin family protein n=1 Tax=Actinoplanes sp. G11-F43 TaxID=3424130 RepID=UPI003D33D07A